MSKGKSKKKMLIAVVISMIIIVAVGGITTALRGKEQGIAVNVMAVEKGAIIVTVPANGILEEIDRHMVFTENATKVLSVKVQEGDYVQKGQLLAVLDTKDLSHQLEIKKHMLDIDKIELEKLETISNQAIASQERKIESSLGAMEEAKKVWERKEELYHNGAIAKQEYEASQRNYEDAKRAYEEAKANNNTTEFDIERMRRRIKITELEIEELKKDMQRQSPKITSPIEGIVIDINLQEGAMSNPTNPSFIVSNIENLEIQINVSEYDIAKVEVGQIVTIETDAIPGESFEGMVERIAPVAKRMSTGQTTETIIPVTIKVKETDAVLKPGFSVRTKIISEEKEDVLIVPFDTIITEANGAKVVFVVREGLLHKVEVQTGIESDFDVEIIDGLQEGDEIVANPSVSLQEGDTVIINGRHGN
ncbi:MAG: efflux RND transporter periplasmic adaptor subunit [Clostridiaceae bacterium]|nr:efflux RND transporter periplasmic adaptor subunit [Clostridiaceae bacterium]